MSDKSSNNLNKSSALNWRWDDDLNAIVIQVLTKMTQRKYGIPDKIQGN